MAYATKYYDYQIAIIFAILLAGLLLLALVVGAIYFICVVNMRGKKGSIARAPSGRNSIRTRMDWTTSQQQQPYIPTQPQQYQQQQYGIPGTEYIPQQPQYSYPPQPAYDSSGAGVRIRELQPDYFQQQGPITYTSGHPYDQQQQQSYQPQPSGTAASYHMSSV